MKTKTKTKKVTPAISLSLVPKKKEKYIQIRILNEKRIAFHGFGAFLEDYDPNEVLITKEAQDALLTGVERGGLQGMEFWPHNLLAFMAGVVPMSAINVPEGAKKWIKKFKIAP